VERVKRCVIHYAAPDGMVYPFCAYNSGPTFRERVERQFSIPIETKEEMHRIRAASKQQRGSRSRVPELVG
jgi:uncharacterized radical SAM superfamily Fe-S cluster-containing enzyme